MPQPQRSDNVMIISTVFVTFVGYATVALPLAVVPIYVHATLGFSTTVAGIAVSLQYIATILSRSQVGQMSDRLGAKVTVTRGLFGAVAGGFLMVLAALVSAAPVFSLGILLCSRLALGVAESLISTGAIAWAIGRVGPQRTARIISWNGIATYSALMIGAPLGVGITRLLGFQWIGWADLALGLAGLALVLSRPAVEIVRKERLSSGRVLWRVLPYGTVLALASMGFGTITTFATLFFNNRGWNGAAYCLSAFGLGFIVARLLFADMIARFGGVVVTAVSLVAQTTGLFLVWNSAGPTTAIAGSALTGLGYAMVFPAMAVEAVERVPPQSRGAAIGIFSVFLDVALGIAGPASGVIAEHVSYSAPFLFGTLATASALLVVAFLRHRLPEAGHESQRV